MDVSWLVLLVSAAVFLSLLLLAAVCMDCWNKGALAHPTTDLSSIHSPSNLPSPFQIAPDPGSQRRHVSNTPTETESNPSYENSIVGEQESVNSEPDNGYIIVLAARPSTPCSDDYVNVRESANSKSSVAASDEETDHEYQNVNPNEPTAIPEYFGAPEAEPDGSSELPDQEAPGPSDSSSTLNEMEPTSESSGGDSSGDEGNYVNQLPLNHSQLAQCVVGRARE